MQKYALAAWRGLVYTADLLIFFSKFPDCATFHISDKQGRSGMEFGHGCQLGTDRDTHSFDCHTPGKEAVVREVLS